MASQGDRFLPFFGTMVSEEGIPKKKKKKKKKKNRFMK